MSRDERLAYLLDDLKVRAVDMTDRTDWRLRMELDRMREVIDECLALIVDDRASQRP
jgi:hypothetical protein